MSLSLGVLSEVLHDVVSQVVPSWISTRACPELQIPSRVGSSVLITARVRLDSWSLWQVVYGFCYCHDMVPPPCSAPVAAPLTLLSLACRREGRHGDYFVLSWRQLFFVMCWLLFEFDSLLVLRS